MFLYLVFVFLFSAKNITYTDCQCGNDTKWWPIDNCKTKCLINLKFHEPCSAVLILKGGATCLKCKKYYFKSNTNLYSVCFFSCTKEYTVSGTLSFLVRDIVTWSPNLPISQRPISPPEPQSPQRSRRTLAPAWCGACNGVIWHINRQMERLWRRGHKTDDSRATTLWSREENKI